MMIEELKEKTRELQLLHVTRDIQSVFRDGEDKLNTQEAANLEALMKQRERLHRKVGAPTAPECLAIIDLRCKQST